MPRHQRKLKVSDDVKTYVKKAITEAPEKKKYVTYQDNPFAGVVNYDVGSFQSLTGMVQGTTDRTRIGDVIKPISMELRYFAQANQDATGASATSVRYIVFIDKDHLAAAAVIADVLELQPGTSDFCAPYNIQNVPARFTILYDKMVDLPAPAYGAVSYGNTQTTRAFIKGLPGKIFFNGGGLGKNEMQSLITSNRSNALALEPRVVMTSSLIYTDN